MSGVGLGYAAPRTASFWIHPRLARAAADPDWRVQSRFQAGARLPLERRTMRAASQAVRASGRGWSRRMVEVTGRFPPRGSVLVCPHHLNQRLGFLRLAEGHDLALILNTVGAFGNEAAILGPHRRPARADARLWTGGPAPATSHALERALSQPIAVSPANWMFWDAWSSAPAEASLENSP